MENQRLFLWLALGLVAWLTWQAWVKDHRQPPPATPVEAAAPAEEPLPAAPGGAATEIPPPVLPGAGAPPAEAPSGEATAVQGRRIRVATDVLELVIDTAGGDLVSARLPRYPVHKDRPDEPVRLLAPDAEDFYVIRSGLRDARGASAAGAGAVYQADQDEYLLPAGADSLEVPLTWTGPDGLRVRKVFSLERGRYAVGLRQEVVNDGGEEWRGAGFVQIQRRHHAVKRSMTDVDTYSFRGPVVYDGDKYEKLKVNDLAEEPFTDTVTGGWIASIQHHFLTAAVPPADAAATIAARVRGDVYTLTAVGSARTVPAGGETVFRDELFIGPKLQSQLRETAPGLRLTVDYGFLTVIAQPLFWVLQKIHSLIGNWGWAIVMVTILIKLAFYKLSETSGKSMAKMRKLQPRLKALQERYADDRQALSQAMMELYKKEKVNPAAGCLPILVQMPVFLALYWVLLESVEMRQAPFMLWINDLSARDPYFILPLLMGITMFAQQRLNPAPPDPVQAKVMMALPVVFTVFFAFFPAGLVLYWFVNNLLSIAQQWRINRVVERGA